MALESQLPHVPSIPPLAVCAHRVNAGEVARLWGSTAANQLSPIGLTQSDARDESARSD
jgi:hypothetical protein